MIGSLPPNSLLGDTTQLSALVRIHTLRILLLNFGWGYCQKAMICFQLFYSPFFYTGNTLHAADRNQTGASYCFAFVVESGDGWYWLVVCIGWFFIVHLLSVKHLDLHVHSNNVTLLPNVHHLWSNHLQTLCLHATGNHLGMGSLQPLFRLKSLVTLILNIGENPITERDVRDLVRWFLRCRHTLMQLTLMLENTLVGDRGLFPLTRLRYCLRLNDLTLRFAHNQISWLGCKRLAMVAHAPNLENIVVDVAGNPIGDLGVVALSSMRWCNRRLRRFELNLRSVLSLRNQWMI